MVVLSLIYYNVLLCIIVSNDYIVLVCIFEYVCAYCVPIYLHFGVVLLPTGLKYLYDIILVISRE